MVGTDKKTNTVTRLDHVITVGLVGDRAKMQEWAIKENEKPVMRIVGRATSCEEVAPKEGSTNKRPTMYIKGQFRATDLVSGEIHLSGQLILPDSASAFVTASLAPDANGHITPQDIDITIKVVRAEKSITGYKHIAELNNYNPDFGDAKNETAETPKTETEHGKPEFPQEQTATASSKGKK